MPSRHLSSNPLLEQAVAITEAAVLMYDVRDRDSFRLATRLAEFVRETTSGMGSGPNSTGMRREYGLMLVGNKADSDGEDGERQVSWAEGRKAAMVLSRAAAAGGVHTIHGRMVLSTSTVNVVADANSPGAPAGAVETGCAFLEVSAKTGENVDNIFTHMARDVIRLRLLNQQRREEAERMMRMRQGLKTPGAETAKRRLGFWKTLTTPFFKRAV
jgi:GTPase SAR1 family protein